MAKRGYKLQEFVAHTANVNCLKIGKKTRRKFITGGDDEKVNLWSIGKPTATTSLSGHTSPIESVAFDSTEVLVAAGASSGVIKLWDLEETNVVRTLNGHRSYCTALEFHPFGEFFASGSMDTNLKIWDIRKKGCIHTYKGHRRAVSTIRFSPDGRWVVSGGLDNVVKIWDLTAGKLLHELKFHEGHIRSMDFHPLEFLLATGSSDKTVKFWDLETFELIGSTQPEATGVRAVTFHPDGRTLFCGLDGSLKVYSWEPVVCHDALDMGWSTLADLCIDDGKLLGCSYYQNAVAVWVADTSLIEPHSHSSEENTRVQSKVNPKQDSKGRIGSPRRSAMSSDEDTKDIKNIYVDSMTPVSSKKSGSLPSVMTPQINKEIDNTATQKQIPAAKFASRELTTNEQENIAVSVKPPAHRRRPSTTKLDIEAISITVEPGLKTGSDTATHANFQKRLVTDAAAIDSSHEKASISTCVTKEIQKPSSPDTLPQENRDKSDESNKELKPVKYVNGVAVVHGRTRSLVERFEKREKLNTDETPIIDTNADIPTKRVNQSFDAVPGAIPEAKSSQMPIKTADVAAYEEPEAKTPKIPIRVNQSFSPSRCDVPDSVTSEESEAKPHKMPIRVNQSFNAAEAKISQMPVKTPDVMASEEHEAKTRKISVRVNQSFNPAPCEIPDAVTSEEPKAMPIRVNQSFNAAEAKIYQMPVKAPDVAASEEPEAKTRKIPIRVNQSFSPAPCDIPDAVTSEEPEAKPPKMPMRVNQSLNAPEAKISQMPVKTPDVAACEEPEAKTRVRLNQSFISAPCEIPDAVSSEEPKAKPPKMPIRVNQSFNTAEAKISQMPVKTPDVVAFKEHEAKTPKTSIKTPDVVSNVVVETKSSPIVTKRDVGPAVKSEEVSASPVRPRSASSMLFPEKGKVSPMQRSVSSRRVMQERGRPSPMLVTKRSNASPRMIPERTTKTSPVVVGPRHDTPTRMIPQKAKSSPLLDDGPQTTGRGLMSKKEDDVADILMQNHDVFISTLRARLTKLQVVRHFWVQNDTKGAINALRKLPDHAVQADVVNVLMEKMESLTLDHFSSLLPVLLDLLDSKTERHISVSLELLLKLVAVFGPVISSTISAPPTVGVDLHAEKRLECCNECHIQLQKIRKCLPDITRRGGLLARCAQELNMVLQKS